MFVRRNWNSLVNKRKPRIGIAALGSIAMIGAMAMQVAQADVVTLSYTATSSGTSGPGTNTLLAVPGSHTFGNSQGSLTTPVYTTGGGQSFEFYDDYVFSISGANANVLSSSINLGNFLGLENFQVRLYELAGNTPLPQFGAPLGGTLLESWSTSINFSPGVSGIVNVIPEHALGAGSYVLEVRGNVSGLAGGSYTGQMNLVPAVPLPAAVWFLVSGLGGLGALVRRKR
jgi:hypothetical protein